MCTYQTITLDVSGSAKGGDGWFAIATASVYFDHPVHASPAHTLNIDLLNMDKGPGARVAIELHPDSARALALAVLAALDGAQSRERDGDGTTGGEEFSPAPGSPWVTA
jgi:hypothetical protein